MAYITREDGEHFVIPSYREVLSGKQKNVLKKDIFLLSQSYGEYITLQKKNQIQYEIAFSPDTGYLLGETVWHHFKKPQDLIYCEVVPGTTEVIMVIVKDGSVYLDGRFPVESIPEELVVFLTQENHFEIYIYGDVPISQGPETGKFNFEPSVVKSFTVLDKPVFANLPLLKIYQLQLVDVVLKAQGIGVFPTKQLVGVLVVAGLVWMLWSYITSVPQEVIPTQEKVNPYLTYNQSLATPDPNQEMKMLLAKLNLLFTLPGWTVTNVTYSHGSMVASVVSGGAKAETLINWAKKNEATFGIQQNGFTLTLQFTVPNRPVPVNIYPINSLIATIVDRTANVYPGNSLQLGGLVTKDVYTDAAVTINVSSVSPMVLDLIGQQWKDLPVILNKISLANTDGLLSGSIQLDLLGS